MIKSKKMVKSLIMKTQCPHCDTIQEIPKEYADREVKCLGCDLVFVATKKKLDLPKYSHKPKPQKVTQPKPKSEPGQIKCPNCGSAQIMGNKKGFSGGKAVGGALLLGPLGLLTGLHGSKKVVITCLNCGHKWEP